MLGLLKTQTVKTLSQVLRRAAHTWSEPSTGVASHEPVAQTGWRRELKFTCEEADFDRLMPVMFGLTAGFQRCHPQRQINSLYFDTFDWSDWAENLAGLPERAKLRLRWYGCDPDEVGGTLEGKVKRGDLGRKVTMPVAAPLRLGTRTWRELRELLLEQAGPLRLALGERDTPVLISRYQRQYFASPDGALRMTLDHALTILDQSLSPRPNLRRAQPLPRTIVIEVKAQAGHEQRLRDVCAEWPLRAQAYSKYSTGLAALLAGR